MDSNLRIIFLYIMCIAQTINIAVRDVSTVQGLVITIAILLIMTNIAFGGKKKESK